MIDFLASSIFATSTTGIWEQGWSVGELSSEVDGDLRLLVSAELSKYQCERGAERVDADYCTVVDLRSTEPGPSSRLDIGFQASLFGNASNPYSETLGFMTLISGVDSEPPSMRYSVGLCDNDGEFLYPCDWLDLFYFDRIERFLERELKWCITRCIRIQPP